MWEIVLQFIANDHKISEDFVRKTLSNKEITYEKNVQPSLKTDILSDQGFDEQVVQKDKVEHVTRCVV